MFDAGCITVSSNGSVGEAFYQPEPFVASDDIAVLKPIHSIDRSAALFLCTVISNERYRFNYGRKWFLNRMREHPIWLPVDAAGKPDWAYMAAYIDSMPLSKVLVNPNGLGAGLAD
jgi:hypothetical protein